MKNKVSGLCLSLLLLAACGSPENNGGEGDAGLSGSVKIDGSSTVYPISEAVAEEFLAVHRNVRVTVGLSGTGGGFKKFSRGETDVNDASRPIKQKEIDMCAENNISYFGMTVAYDGLSVVIHPENDFASEMTLSELKMIWEPAAQGTITRWNQIRPEWPDEEFHLYGPGTESGTYDYFTEVIVGESHSSRGDFTASEDDNVLVQGVAGDRNALGFFGFAYYEENSDKLKLVAVDDENDENGAGAILPSIETVMNKTYSPLSRPLFIYVNSSAVARPEVREFINFYIDNAGALAGEVGYIAMTDEEYAAAKAKFSSFLTEQGY